MDRFYFSNGESAGGLDELLKKLKVIDDECFFHHVNEEKNDFENWIRECVKDKALAHRISKMKEKDKIIASIKKRVHTPARKKKHIIHQIKEAILNG